MKSAFFVLACLLVSVPFIRADYFLAATSPAVSVVGRTAVGPSSNLLYDWSAVSFKVEFIGTGLLAHITDGGNCYNIFIDNDSTPDVLNTTTSPTSLAYTLVENLPEGLHTVRLEKRTEAMFGQVSLDGFTVSSPFSAPPAVLPPTPINSALPARKIEIIGDSISCGFGNEGVAPCDFTPFTENSYNTYGLITARALGAEAHVEAWSGRGIVRNYNDPNQTSAQPLPYFYPKAVANNPDLLWDFNMYIPEVIVINLGTNDMSTQPQPTDQQFTGAYLNFISYLRSKYGPMPHIFTLCGPMIDGLCCDYVQEVVKSASANGDERVTYVDMHVLSEPTDIGCAGHPSVQGHTKMANALIPVIQKTMSW